MQKILPFLFFLIPGLVIAQVKPIWSHTVDSIYTFCSPQVVDLNGDQVLDIVIGGGQEEGTSTSGVLALDGQNGKVLWKQSGSAEIFITPIFQDINHDGIADVFTGGRNEQFFALDGKSGQLIWRFHLLENLGITDSTGQNFYHPQWLPDLNGDGIKDILISRGGAPFAGHGVKTKRVSTLMVISGLDGRLIAQDTMPDGKPTYLSPLLMDLENKGEAEVLYGSGGETTGGHLWRVSLDDVLQGDLSGSSSIVEDSTKGYISVPSLADFTGDHIFDIVIPGFGGKLSLVDGATGVFLWQKEWRGHEMYSSPTIGQFTGDSTPDVCTFILEGFWPVYTACKMIVIDGATGLEVWHSTCDFLQLAGPNALDWDKDGYDEILFLNNSYTPGDTSFEFQSHMNLFDINDGDTISLGKRQDGFSAFSMPLLIDIDRNGLLDIIYTIKDATEGWLPPSGYRIYRVELDFSPVSVAWGGYLGPYRNGHYHATFPNPIAKWLQLKQKE